MLQSSMLRAISCRSIIKVGPKWVLIKRGLCEEGSAVTQGTGDTQYDDPLPTNHANDPASHASKHQVEVTPGSNPHRPTQDPLPLNPPIASSPKLGHTEVGLHSKPNTHHTRQNSTHSPQPQPGPIPEVACSGLDVNPWPDDDDTDQKAQNKAQHEDNKEYFKDHKASPLSEIEFADSRKPISQAMDTNTSVGGPILFNEEQEDTAEGTLMRAAEIFKWNKMRGDPDSPHGRVLRELRGEFW